MKRLILALLIPFGAFAQSEKGFTIKGNVAGLKDSTLVFLATGNGSTVAQTYAFKGKFELFGKADAADVYQLGFIGHPETFELFLTNDALSVSGKSVAIKTLAITGSQPAKDYQEYQKRFLPIKERLNNSAMRVNSMPSGKQRDSLLAVHQKAIADLQVQIDKFVEEKPNSAVTAFILYVTLQLNPDPNKFMQRYSQLSGEAKENSYGQNLEQIAVQAQQQAMQAQPPMEEFGAIGSEAPTFVQNDTLGNPVSLTSFRGKYVLIDFWASWCGPCRRENPNLVAAFEANKEKNFTVLGVSLDMDKQNWLAAIQKDRLAWTHVSDLAYWSNAVAKQYRVNGIPQNFLVNPEGKIIAKNLRGEQLHKVLAEMLQ